MASNLDNLEDYVYYVIRSAKDVIAQAERPNVRNNDDRYVPLEGVYPQDTPLESLSTAIKRIASAVMEVKETMQGDSYTKKEKYKIAYVVIDTELEAEFNTTTPEHQDPKINVIGKKPGHYDVPAHVINISDNED